MSSRVNMHDIAKRAGVSIGTVSNVVNGVVVVRDPLRRKVLQAIEELGYQPSQLARALRRDYSNMIGMIIPDVTNPFFPALVRAAEDVAYSKLYRLVLCNSDNDPKKEASYLNELQSYLPAGLLLIPAVESRLSHAPIHNGRTTPTVCIDRMPKGWKGDIVKTANEAGAYSAAHHLIDYGHRRIGMITGPPHLANSQERLKGFQRALKEARISIPAAYVQAGNLDRPSGLEAALRLLRLSSRPTAIFAANDLMAMGALLAVRELGLHCPEDVSIVGFDNLDVVELLMPPLTTVQQPAYKLGAAAAELLLQRISGLTEPAHEVVLDTTLVRRASVRRIGQRTQVGSARKATRRPSGLASSSLHP